jgi:hypothetical protein
MFPGIVHGVVVQMTTYPAVLQRHFDVNGGVCDLLIALGKFML